MKLRYNGKAKHLLAALRRFREQAPQAGSMAGDELNRYRFATLLAKAELRSMYGGGVA